MLPQLKRQLRMRRLVKLQGMLRIGEFMEYIDKLLLPKKLTCILDQQNLDIPILVNMDIEEVATFV